MPRSSTCTVENVVSAPQNPAPNRGRRTPPAAVVTMTHPSTHAPATFTAKVAHGHAPAWTGAISASSTRNTAPRNPPAKRAEVVRTGRALHQALRSRARQACPSRRQGRVEFAARAPPEEARAAGLRLGSALERRLRLDLAAWQDPD